MSEVRYELTPRGPSLTRGQLTLTADTEAGTFALTDASGRTVLSDAATTLALSDGTAITSRGAGFVADGPAPAEDAHGRGTSLQLHRKAAAGDPEVTLTITIYKDQPFAVLRSELANTTSAELKIAAFHVIDGAHLDVGSPAASWRIYREGWQNWTPALVLPVSGEDIQMSPPVIGTLTRPPAQPGRFLSEMMTAIADPASNAGLVAGFVSTADQFSQLWLDREPQSLTAASHADGIAVPPGGRLASERLLIEPATDALAAMQRYGDALKAEMRAVPWPQPVSGWCSWYYYYQGVTEEDILANLEFLRWHKRELPVEYVQIDDGYQAGIGDWLQTNDKFPRGMGWLAKQIHGRGYKAGLWLAPFMIGEKSQLWADHPDWAVQYSPGRPQIAMLNWGQRCFAMDTSRPDVLEWLGKLFRTIFDEWRYDYVKIDFLYAAAVDGIRHDPAVTRAQAYRRAIELIRSIAGERFILGCGQPIGPSIGVFNGARISPDVAPFWRPLSPPVEADNGRDNMSNVSTLNALRNTLGRFWMHDRLWLNDPDCMMARNSETALTTDEVQTLATAIALSGGMTLDSDPLPALPDGRRQLLSMLLPVYGRSAIPLDLFQSDMPRLFQLDCGTHTMLGVFNWLDEPADVTAPLPKTGTHVFEAWSQEYLGILRDTVTFRLPAHGCKLLALRPAAGHPQVVGTSLHALQGTLEIAAEEWDGKTLVLHLRPVAKREGDLFIAATQPPTADGAEVRTAGPGLWATRVQVDTEQDLRITFTPA
jgi:alpha-galactosidase